MRGALAARAPASMMNRNSRSRARGNLRHRLPDGHRIRSNDIRVITLEDRVGAGDQLEAPCSGGRFRGTVA